MYNFFRINDPYRLLGLLVLLVLLYLPGFIYGQWLTVTELHSLLVGEKVSGGFFPYSEIIDPTPPLTLYINGLFDVVFGRYLPIRHFLGFFLLFLHSSIFALFLLNKKAFYENTYIPALLYSVLCFFSFDNLQLSGELYGAFFLLFALNGLFRQLEFRAHQDDAVFILGILLGLASLCEFSYIAFLAAAHFILILFTRNGLRTHLVTFMGFLLPHLLLVSLYYFNDHIHSLWEFFYWPNLKIDRESFITGKGMLTLGIVPVAFLIISLLLLKRESRFTKYQGQLIQVMFIWMVFGIISIGLGRFFRPQGFVVLVPPMAFFISHFILSLQRKKWAEIYLWTFMMGTVGISYLSWNNKIEAVALEHYIVTAPKQEISGKKILVLDDDVSLYAENVAATPFVNWRVSESIFREPGFYENVALVYAGLKNDPPDIIVDPDNLMHPFLQKIGDKSIHYTRKGNYYFRMINN